LAKAEWLTAANRLDEASASASAAIKSNPDSALAHFALARIYQRQRKVDEAIKSYGEVVRLNPRAVAAQVELSRLNLAAGNRDAAFRFAQEARQIDPTVGTRIALARAALASNNLVRAQTEISALVRGLPNEAVVHVLSGLLEVRRGNHEGARRSFSRALQLAPGEFEAVAGLVDLDVRSKQLPAARQRVESELASRPDSAQLLALAAQVYNLSNQPDKVEQSLRRAVAVDPGFLAAYGMLAQLYVQENRLDDARVEFERLAQKDPKGVSPRTMLGILLETQNKRAEAKKAYEAALAVSDNAAVAANNLAVLYAEEGANLDIALQLATSAKQGLPDDPDVDDTLGWVYYKKNQPALAVGPLEESLKKRPNHPEVLFHLGLAYAKLGDASKARSTLEQALAINPQFPGHETARQTLASFTQ
jgi:tetratricopeptide (TPR) repeat protein